MAAAIRKQGSEKPVGNMGIYLSLINRLAEFVASLRSSNFVGKILLVTAGLPDRDALAMIRAGVAGIFHKQHGPENLRRSIREVFEGEVLIEEHYLRKLVQVATEDNSAAIRLTSDKQQGGQSPNGPSRLTTP
jgi:DNA-binding NarL/FixJ family response regulator